MGQRSEENGRLELLNRNTDQSILKADGQSSTVPFLIHYEVEAQEEVYVGTTLCRRIRQSCQSFRHSQTALSSEDCTLSITLPTKKKQQVNPAQVFERIFQLRTKGLANAFQPNSRTLILAYENTLRRDMAFHNFSRPERVPGIKHVQTMCPETPRRYITWMFQVFYDIIAKELLDALNSYFWG